MAFGSEIKRLRNVHHISAGVLAAAIGIDAERLRSWEKKDLNPRHEDAILIEDYFKTPIGKFSDLEKLPKVPNKEEQELEKVSYQKQRLLQKNGENRKPSPVEEGIPIFDVPIDASFLETYTDASYHPIYFLNIPKLRNCNFGAMVSGSSMYPIMKSGTIAICRIVEDLNYYDPGEMYLISTTNGFETVKYVQAGDSEDELLLIPANEKIKPRTIMKSMIIRMCIVEAWINFR